MTFRSPFFFVLIFANSFILSCQPEKKPSETSLPEEPVENPIPTRQNQESMAFIPSGKFEMGSASSDADADENPVHPVKVDSFWMDRTEVTNAEFREFIEATGYKTVAERKPDWEEIRKTLPAGTPKPHDSLLVPASLVFYPNPNAYDLSDYTAWWIWVPGANWKNPQGPQSNLEGKASHPVVHVSWLDAKAYCEWKNKRLPTEAEWEWASRGGLENPIYPWGNTEPAKMIGAGNFYQGRFPMQNFAEDGFKGTAPVKSYPPNGYGLYDMAGNVWEWCSDLYHSRYYDECLNKGLILNPTGPQNSYDPEEPYLIKRVTRGGSFLCNQVYCSGYRVSRRMKASEDTGLEHTGFRCVSDSL